MNKLPDDDKSGEPVTPLAVALDLDSEPVQVSPKLLRKVDLHLLPCLALLYLVCAARSATLRNSYHSWIEALLRTRLSSVCREYQALAEPTDYKEDLHLAPNDYNIIATAFFIASRDDQTSLTATALRLVRDPLADDHLAYSVSV